MSLTPPVSERDHVQGSATAPVTLVEYGDYECPHCGTVYPIIKQIQQHFGEALRFVFRNFPLNEIHRHAEHASEAAEAAGAAGKFWPMHDIIFEHQTALTDRDLVTYAEAVGVDSRSVAEALARHTFTERVKADFMSGVRSGVNGTPTFFINGERYDGAHDYASLREALTEAGATARK
ncbi:MAG TPA: thioredoxin domain-containing protein [Gemmatimonadaceae bacterium]|jgi:protein-disulfide isomerase|nr:thioredoxin domain-containing protein [Gemmatimonadaceae bacterium]